MELSTKEKAVALVSNAIAAYSLYHEWGKLPENTTMFDFILKATPENMKKEVSIEVVDAVFNYVSSAHSS